MKGQRPHRLHSYPLGDSRQHKQAKTIEDTGGELESCVIQYLGQHAPVLLSQVSRHKRTLKSSSVALATHSLPPRYRQGRPRNNIQLRLTSFYSNFTPARRPLGHWPIWSENCPQNDVHRCPLLYAI
ncbi:hypothetical protein RRG08_003534 [Elysia crispata]|uniref:Uncharacterized protein n=1 Tax=Elysia crispata TaxID=231223 RepID=A0AAE0Y6D9_9GAST|nr:hypothetical protein RRG08_003534 [Elysia crispata]